MQVGMQLGRVTLFFLFIFSLQSSPYDAAVYNITPSHPLAVGQTLVSPGLIFELGFFIPNNSANKYVGLWHKSIFPRKYVWVANRVNPLAATDTLASLRIGSNGNLELVDGKQSYVWLANISNCSSAVLLDNGNFVVKDVMGANLWDSFNNPSDSHLPDMLVGYDRGSGKRNFLTSWKSENDPSPGIFMSGLSADLPAQLILWFNGSTPHWRSGPWDKSQFIGIPASNSLYLNPFTLVDNVTQGRGSRYLSYHFDKIPGEKILAYGDLSSEGIARFWFSVTGKNWYLNWGSWNHPCDSYGACGPYGVCKPSESPMCKCLKGFIPKSNEEWSKGNWTGGCVRRSNLSCQTNTNESDSSKGKDGFLKLERLKVPDFHEYLASLALDKFEDCKIQCLINCSCLAYAYVENIGCLVWSKHLIDIQQFPSFGQDLYVRLADSELGEEKPIKLIASISAIGFISILIAIVFCLQRWRANQKRDVKLTAPHLESNSLINTYRDDLREYLGKYDLSELKIYDFESIVIATDSFSITNKLGQGGFGPVYKGILPEGKEIAVKRLSSSSGQGVEEFKNERLCSGYMSLEYAMGGIFSEKSDVYSFGVLALEIISGKKNTSFFLYDQQLGFLAYAWNLWNEGRALEIVDEVLEDSYLSSEVMTCLHVGLLCVQDNAVDRPTMVDVASILSSEKDGPQPKLPVFTIQNSAYYPQPHYENINSSQNEASITMIEGR